MGYNVDFVDCGGGLGVDYDGTRSSSSESSVNYSIQEYVNDCVYTFVDAANKNNIEHPNLITESGRSLSAITQSWLSMSWRPLPYQKCQRSLRRRRPTTSW